MRPVDHSFRTDKKQRLVAVLSAFTLFYAPMIMADYGLDSARIGQVDTSKWRCKFCPDEEGTTGSVEAYLGYSDDTISQRFKRTEAEGDNGQAALSARVNKTDSDKRLELEANGIGNDSSNSSIAYDDLNSLSAQLSYSRMTHYSDEGAATYYADPKNHILELPSTWVDQNTTNAMDFSTIKGTPTYQQRDNIDAEVEKVFGERGVELTAHYRQQLRSGIHWMSGSILNDVSALANERDDRIRELTVGAAIPFRYRSGFGLAGLEYFRSEYDNDHTALTWENPFVEAIAGSDRGKMALAPDNQYERLRLYGSYGQDRHRLKFSYGQGKGEQDDLYLPYTTNSLLTTQALPQGSYEGEVKTRHARVGWDFLINRSWRLSSRYRYNERENNSPVAQYEPVLTDSLVQGAITNPRYSHQKSELDMDLDWRWRPQTRFGYHYEFEAFKRRDDSTGEYDAHSLELSWNERWSRKIKTRASIFTEDRQQSNRNESLSASDNPYYQDFTVADRQRNQIELNMDWQLSPEITVSGNAAHQDDDYTASEIGVKSNDEHALGVRINWQVSRLLSTHASMQRSWIAWLIAGSAQQAVPTWDSKQKDQYDVFTLGVRRSGFYDDSLTIGADYAFVANRGETDVSVTGDYHDMYSDSHTLHTYLDYDWRPNWQVRFESLYERYKSVDPMLVSVNALPGIISNGARDENYSDWLFGIRLRYEIEK